ncbi:MAG TPA: DUF559 domain-containing protein [Candidatus Dormibacteraeota bacterium]|nr:DUF559 domain-containing protein [Candidatus Dormibacteraeota bacterium]
MGRNARLPVRLLSGVFTVEEARRAGLPRWSLEGSSWVRLGPSQYLWKGLSGDPIHRLTAVHRRLPVGAAFSGRTAAWLHGLEVASCDPIEVTVPTAAGVSNRSGCLIRRSALAKRDVVNARGLPATEIVRTVAETCARLDLIEAIVVADAALHSRRLRIEQLASWVQAHAGFRGVRRVREVLDHAEPASESPMESRLRLVLVSGGLPRPKAQVTIRDRWGRAIGRPDLYYEDQRLGIEYDGITHRDALVEDNRRQNRLLNAGVRLLRFTAGDVLRNPEKVVSDVRSMLSRTPP